MNTSIYEMTLPIVGTENLIMGLTLLVLCLAKKYGRVHNKSGLIFFALAMLAISAINFAEYGSCLQGETERSPLSVVMFAASIELFLFLFAYASMLDQAFVTTKRIVLELSLIVVFTTPSLFISSAKYPTLFSLFFALSIVFYVVKLIHNIYTYKKCVNRATHEIDSYSSDGSAALFRWIHSTFYLVLTVGVVSVVVPLTNYAVLTIYNIFLLFAFLYLYVEIIHNIYVFDYSIAIINRRGGVSGGGYAEIVITHQNTRLQAIQKTQKAAEESVNRGRKIYESWLIRRTFAIPGITADEIASQFGTNRTKLSLYLKKELGMNFYEWIARLRIEDAKRQLIEYPDRPICEIAVNVGIDDKSNFGRMFKRLVGVSPATYRSNYSSASRIK